jgi:hypothetical protein
VLGALVALTCRALVGIVFALTAGWKLTHRREFESSFRRLAPRAIDGLDRLVVWPLAACELTLMGLLLAGTDDPVASIVGSAAAFVLVGVFTVALAFGEDGDCGCWSASVRSSGRKNVVVVRNVVLLGVLAVGAFASPGVLRGVSVAAGAVCVAAGGLFAIVLVEVPTIADALASRPQRADLEYR